MRKNRFETFCPDCRNPAVEDGAGQHFDDWEEMYKCDTCNKRVYSCRTLSRLDILSRYEGDYRRLVSEGRW